MEEASYVLGPVTSLLVWRAAQLGVRSLPERVSQQPDLASCRARVRSIRGLADVRLLGDVPLDVIVGSTRATHTCKSMDVIVLDGELPEGSFCLASEGLYVCSPELCYALLGRGGRRVHLWEIASELCGTYALNFDGSGSFANAPTLTSRAELIAFLQKMRRRHGVRTALSALDEVLDDAGSPRETSLYLMLTVNAARGGYGITKPKLNAKIAVSEQTRDEWAESFVCIDEVFYDEDDNAIAGVEYDSFEHHVHAKRQSFDGSMIDVAKIIADGERCEIIRDAGVDLVTVRKRDTSDFGRFERKALRIGKLAGCKPLPSTGHLRSKRLNLFGVLFDSRRWSNEYEELRVMAGYERHITHPKARRRKGEASRQICDWRPS